MIIKSFNLNDLRKSNSNFFLFYGSNDGYKEETINEIFLGKDSGEVIRYDEGQILNDKNSFFETCLNESLFEEKKIIIVSRITSKFYEIIKDLTEKNLSNKKIILNSNILEKKSKIRQLFEKEKNLVCVPFYDDNASSLYKIASDFFKKNKISISSENINLIVNNCAGDRKNLKNEMDKILNFSFTNTTVNKDQILKLINLYENENYFELIDSCLAKNRNKVFKIINSNTFNRNDAMILIRSFISRLKRLLELKKLSKIIGNNLETINQFKPPIFWKDKEIVTSQMNNWTTENIYTLLDELNSLEISFKKNNDLSCNVIFDLIFNTSNKTNSLP